VPGTVLSQSQHLNIRPVTNPVIRVPLAVKSNHAPLSPKTKNIQKPSLETTCLSSCAPKRASLKRTPSIRLGEGIGGKATVVFEESEVFVQQAANTGNPSKKRKPIGKPSRPRKIQRDDPGKENIPPPPATNITGNEPKSADLEEIALGLVALQDARWS
jgi:hypothetical protein